MGAGILWVIAPSFAAHASPVPKMGALTSPDFNPILPPQ